MMILTVNASSPYRILPCIDKHFVKKNYKMLFIRVEILKKKHLKERLEGMSPSLVGDGRPILSANLELDNKFIVKSNCIF